MKIFAVIVPLALVTLCSVRSKAPESKKTPQSEDVPASEAKPSGGWQSLFNGKSTKGWHTYGSAQAGSAWQAQDSVLHLDASSKTGRGDLVSDSEYANFDLKLDWKVTKGTNSGIMFLVHEDASTYPDTYNTGPEMQVLDNDGNPDGRNFKHRAGDLYDLIPCRQQTVKAVGEWNYVEIRLKNGRLKFTLNGVDVVETKMWTPEWDTLVAHSKFATMPGFATFHKGHISLQDHGGNEDVWFKNIQIREL
jgi:hypothetical protein